jgi:hypothetical protein
LRSGSSRDMPDLRTHRLPLMMIGISCVAARGAAGAVSAEATGEPPQPSANGHRLQQHQTHEARLASYGIALQIRRSDNSVAAVRCQPHNGNSGCCVELVRHDRYQQVHHRRPDEQAIQERCRGLDCCRPDLLRSEPRLVGAGDLARHSLTIVPGTSTGHD